MMRSLFFLILVAGLGLAGYSWVSATVLERTLGTWRVYDSVTDYIPAQVQLKSDDAPVQVEVDMSTTGLSSLNSGEAILTLTASTGGKTVLAKALDFKGAVPRDTNPQTQEKMFRDTAGVIDAVQTGTYEFKFDKGDAEGIPIHTVDLILRSGAAAVDGRLQPLGFVLMAVGFIGLVLAFRHGGGGGTPQNPNSQPPPPRWGRGASS